MTEREKYLNHRIPVLRKMLEDLEAERDKIRRRRTDAYLDHLERGCNTSMELTE